MMEYAQAANTKLSGPLQARPSPELGRLKSASERIAKASCSLTEFIARLNGPTPEGVSDGAATTDNYRDDLNTLFSQIDQLENLVSQLDHIG